MHLGLLLKIALLDRHVDRFLVLLELDVRLHNVDIGCFEQAAHLSDVGWSDLVVAVEASHGL